MSVKDEDTSLFALAVLSQLSDNHIWYNGKLLSLNRIICCL